MMEYVEARQKAEEEIVGFLKRLESEIGGYVRTVGGRLEELATGVEKGDGEERDTEGGNTEMEV